MPKIPIPDYMTVQDAPIGAPNIQQDLSPIAASVGAGIQALGQGIAQSAQTVANVYQQEHKKAQVEVATNNEADLQKTINEQLYDPESGLMAKKGDAALQALDPTLEAIQKKVSDSAENINDFETRKVYLQRARTIFEEAHKTAQVYVGHQRLEAQEASADALAQESLRTLAQQYDASPEDREKIIAQPEAAFNHLSLSPEAAKAKIAQWRQTAASTILDQYLSPEHRDWQGAQTYFDSVKDQLGTARTEYERTISTMRSQVVGDGTALTIINNHRMDNGFIDDAGAAKALEDLPAGPEKKQTEEAFAKYMSLEKQAEGNKKNQAFTSAFSAFLGNHSLSDVPAQTKAWLTKNDPTAWNRLEDVARSWQTKDAKTDAIENGNYIAIRSAMEQNPLKFKDMSPEEFTSFVMQNGVSAADYRKLGDVFAQVKKTKDYELPKTATAVTDLFQHAFGESRPDPKKWTPEHQALWNTVHDSVEREANVYVRDHNGKLPRDEELAAFANKSLVKGTVVGGGTLWGDKSGVTKVEAETLPRFKGKTFQEDIPKDLQKQIADKFKSKGVAKPSDDQIRAAFDRMKGAQ